MSIESLIGEWDGLGVVTARHRATGSWIFVALHDATLGRPTGGCRIMTYDSPAAGLKDAMRLAEGMTFKWAAMDFAFGGGKSVLAVPGPMKGEARRALLTRYAQVLNALGDGYGVGEDLGTTPADMAFLSSLTSAVAGCGAAAGGHPLDPGPFTAAGVHAGITAALAHLEGGEGHRADSDGSAPERVLEGVRVVVEGVGAVGGVLATLLARSGARVLVADVNAERARAVARECDGRVVRPDQVTGVECDVYAPCAVGATVSAATIPRLRCRVVAGAANNQLDVPADAERLLERGILCAPDFVVNGGGAMAFGLMDQGLRDPDDVTREVARRIGRSLGAIFREADREGVSPVKAARRVARRTLMRAADGGAR